MEITLSSVCSLNYKLLQQNHIMCWEELSTSFTYQNPDYIKNEKLGFSNYGVEMYIHTYKIKGDLCHFGFGAKDKVIQILKKHNINFTINDKFNEIPKVDYPWSKVILRPDQQEFIDALAKAKNGIGIAPTSFGKSLSTLELIKKLQLPAVIIVHTEFLQKQWIKEATNPDTFNLPKKYIGGCGGIFKGSYKVGLINICLYHSLSNPDFLQKFIRSVGIVVQDEVQKAPIDAVQKCLLYFPTEYKFGVTAQVKRKDKKEFMTFDAIGEVVHTAKEANTDSKILSSIFLVPTDYEDDAYQWDKNYVGLINRMSLDQERNKLILNRAFRKIQENKQVLIFVERKAQAFVLASALQKKGIKVGLLIGGVGKDQIKELSGLSKEIAEQYDDKKAYNYVLKNALTKELQVIIGTQKAEVGLSIRTLNHAIITTPVGNSMEAVQDRLNQMIGRVERTHGEELEAKFGKKPIPTVDILIDEKLPSIARQAKYIKQFYGKRVTHIRRS